MKLKRSKSEEGKEKMHDEVGKARKLGVNFFLDVLLFCCEMKRRKNELCKGSFRKRLHGIDIITHCHVLLLYSHMHQYAFHAHFLPILPLSAPKHNTHDNRISSPSIKTLTPLFSRWRRTARKEPLNIM